jgi:hypothetical protein
MALWIPNPNTFLTWMPFNKVAISLQTVRNGIKEPMPSSHVILNRRNLKSRFVKNTLNILESRMALQLQHLLLVLKSKGLTGLFAKVFLIIFWLDNRLSQAGLPFHQIKS